MRKGHIFVSLILFFFCNELRTQTSTPDFSYHITIDLQNVVSAKDRVKVTITPPPIKARVIYYVLPIYIPGIEGKVDAGRFVHQFYALDDKGFPLKVSKKKNGIIVLKLSKGATLKKIEYWVDDTWDDEKTKSSESNSKFNYVPQAAGSNIDAGNNYVLNHAFFFGYIKGFSDVPYTITILKPEELAASSALKIIPETQTRDSYKTSNYKQLLDNPVMYSRPDSCGFFAGNIYVSISVYSENGRVSSRLVRRLIAAHITSASNFIPEVGEKKYEMIFYFTTPFKTVLNSNGGYGGLVHKGCAFYFMPELEDEEALATELQRETAGDILHLLKPLDYQCMANSNDFTKPQLMKSWWFSEGVNLYFGWLSAVRDSFVSEGEFMGNVSLKIRLAQLAPNKPMTDLKSLTNCLDVPLKREALRSKAMLLAFLLDIKISELTEGKMGLKEAVLELDKHETMIPDSLESWLVKITDPRIAQFFRDYVDGIKPMPLMSEFEKIGWAYAPSTIDSALTFGAFGLLYNDNLDAFFVYNADTSNLFGLRDGDRIVSVDGMILGSSTFDDALHSVYSPTMDREVQLRFIRKDLNYTSSAIPYIKVMLVEYLIRMDPAAPAAAIKLHRQVFSPTLF